MNLLDTNVIIYLQKGQLKHSLPQDEYAISVITEIELLSFSGLSSNQETWLQDFIAAIQVFPLDPTVKDTTIALRRKHKLKTPDAIIIATALVQALCLFTADKQLLQLPKLRSHHVDLMA